MAKAIDCKVKGVETGIVLTENDLVFVTNGSCTEGTIYGDQNHAPNGDAEVRTSGCWSLWKNIAKQDPAFGHPEKFCSDIAKTNWESATVTTLDDKILPYIEKICQRDPRSGKTVTGGIVSCKDSSWLLSWTINRQGQFKEQDKDKVCVWVYGLFTDVPGDYIKKPMKECTGKEITEEWLYHLGVPEDQIEDLAEHSAVCVPTMMPYITAFSCQEQRETARMSFRMAVSTLHSSDSLPRRREIPYLQPSIPCVLQWKLSTDCSVWTVVCRKSGAASTMCVSFSTAA